jgi:hypothetical protein
MKGYRSSVAQILPRFRPDQNPKAVDKAIDEAGERPLPGEGRAGGDRWRLRGIPVVGRGVGGTSPGTDPYAALDRLERRSA